MERSFDERTKALYVQVSDQEVKRTVQVTSNVLVDLAADGSAVGLEMLDTGVSVIVTAEVDEALHTYGFPEETRRLIAG